jgi:hypothetical protein
MKKIIFLLFVATSFVSIAKAIDHRLTPQDTLGLFDSNGDFVVMPFAALTDVVSGQELTMDGNSQLVTLKQTETFKHLTRRDGSVTFYLYIDAAAGARIGDEVINDSIHKLFAQDARVVFTTVMGYFYIKGTNGQKITVTF